MTDPSPVSNNDHSGGGFEPFDRVQVYDGDEDAWFDGSVESTSTLETALGSIDAWVVRLDDGPVQFGRKVSIMAVPVTTPQHIRRIPLAVAPDAMDTLPVDHGSDRYGHVEYSGAPEGVVPTGLMVDRMLAIACEDCNPNLFLRWAECDDPERPGWIDANGNCWQLTIAHDDTCPRYAQLEADGKA